MVATALGLGPVIYCSVARACLITILSLFANLQNGLAPRTDMRFPPNNVCLGTQVNHRSLCKPKFITVSTLLLNTSYGHSTPPRAWFQLLGLEASVLLPWPQHLLPPLHLLPLLYTPFTLAIELVTTLNRTYPFTPPHLCTKCSFCRKCPPPFATWRIPASPASSVPCFLVFLYPTWSQAGLDSWLCHLLAE